LLVVVLVSISECSKPSSPNCESALRFSTIRNHDVLLNPAIRRTKISQEPSPLPCQKKIFDEPKNLFVPVKGHTCIQYHVRSSQGATVCFLPDVVWFALGKDQIVEDRVLCECVGQKDCSKRAGKLQLNSTYLLYATPHGASQPNHIEVEMKPCADSNQSSVLAACAGLLILVGLFIKVKQWKIASQETIFTQLPQSELRGQHDRL